MLIKCRTSCKLTILWSSYRTNSDDKFNRRPQDQNPLKYVQWLGRRNMETGIETIAHTHTHTHTCTHRHTYVYTHTHTHTHTHTCTRTQSHNFLILHVSMKTVLLLRKEWCLFLKESLWYTSNDRCCVTEYLF
jgi:hypothetical protein